MKVEMEMETNRLMYIISNLLNRMQMMHCSIFLYLYECIMFLSISTL